MLMADDNSNSWFPDDLTAVVGDDDAWDELCIDLDSFLDILGETPGPSQHGQDNPSLNLINMPQGLPNSERAPSLREELPGSVIVSPSHNSEASDSRTGGSDGSFEPVGNFHINMVPPMHSGSPVCSTASLSDWMLPLPGHGSHHAARDIVSQEDDNKDTQFKILNYSTPFCVPAGYVNNVLDDRGPLKFNNRMDETECQFRYSKEDDAHCQYSSHNQSMEKSDISYRNFYNSSANNSKMLGAPKTKDTYFMNVDIPDMLYETDNKSLAEQFCLRTDGSSYSGPSSNIFPDSIDFLSLPNVLKKKFVSDNNGVAIDLNGESGEVPSQDAYSDGAISFEARGGNVGGKEGLVTGNLGLSGPYHSLEVDNHILPQGRYCFDEPSNMLLFDDTLAWPVHPTPANMSSEKNHACGTYESDGELVASQTEVVNNAAGDDPFIGKSDVRDENENIYVIDDTASKRVRRSLGIIDDTAFRNPAPGADEYPLDLLFPAVQPSASVRNHLECPKGESESTKRLEHVSANCHEIPSNNLAQLPDIDDDLDICTLEDMGVPYRDLSPVNGKSLVTQRSTFSEPVNHMVGSVKLKTNDERFVFRVALQDLSQPKSEATPPDGVLSVPLLRHQRIALSWMVHKETASLHCSGGILADDQGLGKTISTIALILKERSPSSNACVIQKKQNEMETLNLDEDDDVMPDFDGSKQGAKCCQVLTNGSSTKGGNTTVQVKGRPAAGTLIVCPTSVLRQWFDELQNKVTCEANLSVLVYHGSSRTKDPLELAKYDVVLTTYAIVSMEVPKQPLVDEDDDETGKRSQDPPGGVQSSKKRKYPPNCEKSLKGKKGLNCDLLDPIARPLARVRWFRVVLDEAQSIKNYRTQVARACWGLRAKRRWCLSGTPIQNAVDDLYSYFRFLRYDPYAVYKSFCATIKVPIQKNPTNGYKKLQAVLRTIMLRRTKGTKIDGELIINLPPKTVILKQVEFTPEERDFYCRLEADSRAQFAEYAAAGTVKQNYVNILLMLLRLRQACDHPLLVRGYNTGSVLRSSIEMAKKLPLEKRVSLLNCLEASLAICGICNDPPEDAIVASCGHVFCNQCIIEHLTGDDNQCPSPNCKTRLSVSSLFSGASLRNSLSEGSVQDSFPHSGPVVTELLKSGFENCEPLETGSVKTNSLESCPLGSSYDSSKIKAAVEVLQFLSKPRDCTPSSNSLIPMNGTADSTNDSTDVSEGKESGVQDNRYMDLNGDSTHLVSAVGEKAIVFSQWTKMLDLLEACLKSSSIQYRRLDGTMSVLARDKAVKDFNALPEVSVMIMSLKAASLGLNMVAACHVLLLDLWWNPTTEDQAIDRAHRIGQTRPVTVLRLTVKDTVEDRILALQQKKREMVASAFGEDETGSRQSRLTVEDLKYLFMA